MECTNLDGQPMATPDLNVLQHLCHMNLSDIMLIALSETAVE